MKLLESPSPNARRVHVFMAEKGIEIERVPVDIRAGENISAEFLRKNPGGRVPVLELNDGTYLAESVAICRYLEGLQPAPNLFGEDALAQANIEMWARRAELGFMSQVAGAFRNITGFFKDRETPVKEWGEVCADEAVKQFAMFENRLGEVEYIAGTQFSIADITLAIAIDFARQVQVVPLPEAPNVDRWHALVSQRPSFAAT